jgi:hypothetical protein
MCAEAFFDPMPTFWHHLLVLAVPFGNLWVWWLVRQETERARLTWFYWLVNGFVLGVAIYYSLMYAPLTPMALFAIIFMGLGILPLTPIIALAATGFLTRHLLRLRAARGTLGFSVAGNLRGAAWGAALSLVLLFAGEAQEVMTRAYLQMAASEQVGTQARGVQWLRKFGHENTVLRACYGHTGDGMSLLGLLMNVAAPITSDKARQIYYRMTGRAFETAPPPRLRSFEEGRTRHIPEDGTGELMTWPAAGLSMHESQLDGSLDAQAALGYVEWALVFKNDAGWQQEARAHVALPPGGVVSRLTLWVNGEEREAAFAGRGQVTAAYESVVRTKRDPVLVTSSGPDRVQVQCFPVPPNGTMKIRLGITAPLTRVEADNGWFRLPRILERNFAVAADAKHSIWIESKEPLTSTAVVLKAEQPNANLFGLRGQLSHRALSQEFPSIQVKRDPAIATAWTRDASDIILQQAQTRATTAPQRILFVIDGSQPMQAHAAPLAEAFAHIPDGVSFKVLLAGETPVDLTTWQTAAANTRQAAAQALRAARFIGGTDNVIALAQGWDEAAAQPDTAIVWLHAAHPVTLSTTSALQQRLRRRPQAPRLYDLQVNNGANLIAEDLDGFAQVRSATRLGEPAEDLARLLRQWHAGTQELHFTRNKVPASSFTAGAQSKATSKHLARLWAAEEVTRILQEPKPAIAPKPAPNAPPVETPAQRAIKFAAAYQLVTPVTGAVVLETQEQYERAGLKPVDRQTVPTIPEPETWLLLIVVALTLLYVAWQKRPEKRGEAWKLH